ncbi:MAG: tRNA (adenosine(37)-N6)-threonylcarbamoyltransferase complex ATPase subunit type 1 TsaE [Oscillospiraceae bacterium]|nr:tRNA (adenosine(37)-N6)-threonylcarbamoyltransferase complex ATPase subunit type 1 TsaE [Oscillospiraceae bacterium]
MPEFFSDSEQETEEIGFALAKKDKIKFGDIVALKGDLGAGKTAFTRGLAKFFSPSLRVVSPTFSILNEYKTTAGRILHFDMYRIESEEDLLSTGFYDCLGGGDLIVIEWFEKISDFFGENTVNVEIAKLRGDKRKIVFERLE